MKFLIITLSIVGLTSCSNLIPSYTVINNTGSMWPEGEARTVPSKDVTANAQLPEQLGGGVLPIPTDIAK